MLPSAFDLNTQKSLGLTKLAATKYELRKGQAFDVLASLRQIIQEYNHNLLDKQNNVSGVRMTTHSESFLLSLTADKKAAAERYRSSQRALLALGLPKDDTTWRALSDDELWGRSVSKKRRLAQEKKPDPWFWNVARPRRLTTDQQKEWSKDSTSTLVKPFINID